jgi:hypothetical protein
MSPTLAGWDGLALASSTFAEIVMPKEARRDGAVRLPGAGASLEGFRRRSPAESPQHAHRLHQREISGRKDIGAAEREE